MLKPRGQSQWAGSWALRADHQTFHVRLTPQTRNAVQQLGTGMVNCICQADMLQLQEEMRPHAHWTSSAALPPQRAIAAAPYHREPSPGSADAHCWAVSTSSPGGVLRCSTGHMRQAHRSLTAGMLQVHSNVGVVQRPCDDCLRDWLDAVSYGRLHHLQMPQAASLSWRGAAVCSAQRLGKLGSQLLGDLQRSS